MLIQCVTAVLFIFKAKRFISSPIYKKKETVRVQPMCNCIINILTKPTDYKLCSIPLTDETHLYIYSITLLTKAQIGEAI